MKPEEAIEILENKKEYSKRITDNFLDHSSVEIKDANETIEMCDMAISALKEIQQYREIGTVEEIKSVKKYIDLKRRCGTPTNTIDLCAEYITIGTVEECREAVEKQKPKEPTVLKQQHSDSYNCPKCGRSLILKCGTDWFGGQHHKSCPNCGQAIQWENLEGMEDE